MAKLWGNSPEPAASRTRIQVNRSKNGKWREASSEISAQMRPWVTSCGINDRYRLLYSKFSIRNGDLDCKTGCFLLQNTIDRTRRHFRLFYFNGRLAWKRHSVQTEGKWPTCWKHKKRCHCKNQYMYVRLITNWWTAKRSIQFPSVWQPCLSAPK